MTQDVFDSLRDLAASPLVNDDPTAAQVVAASLVARLKLLNRTANSATRTMKEATAAARLEMDESHLGLQNLQYEKRHLEREIEKCRQFASIYQDIPLYTLAEFVERAPEAARSPEVLSDEHQLMLNRLSFELAERQRLDLRRRQLALQKDELLKEGKRKAATIDSVKTQLELFIKTGAEIKKKVDELVLPLSTSS